MNFKYATETFSIVSGSSRDASPRDLCIMTLALSKKIDVDCRIWLDFFVLNFLLILSDLPLTRETDTKLTKNS